MPLCFFPGKRVETRIYPSPSRDPFKQYQQAGSLVTLAFQPFWPNELARGAFRGEHAVAELPQEIQRPAEKNDSQNETRSPGAKQRRVQVEFHVIMLAQGFNLTDRKRP
jgi:hypothetical protein